MCCSASAAAVKACPVSAPGQPWAGAVPAQTGALPGAAALPPAAAEPPVPSWLSEQRAAHHQGYAHPRNPHPTAHGAHTHRAATALGMAFQVCWDMRTRQPRGQTSHIQQRPWWPGPAPTSGMCCLLYRLRGGKSSSGCIWLRSCQPAPSHLEVAAWCFLHSCSSSSRPQQETCSSQAAAAAVAQPPWGVTQGTQDSACIHVAANPDPRLPGLASQPEACSERVCGCAPAGCRDSSSSTHEGVGAVACIGGARACIDVVCPAADDAAAALHVLRHVAQAATTCKQLQLLQDLCSSTSRRGWYRRCNQRASPRADKRLQGPAHAQCGWLLTSHSMQTRPADW